MARNKSVRTLSFVTSLAMVLAAMGAGGQQLAVTPGTINTIAGVVGSTTAGSVTYSGPATSGSLYTSANNPLKVVEDSSGNIYFADRQNGVIRKLTPVTAPGTGSNLYGANTAYTMTTIVGKTPAACTGTVNAPAGIESLPFGDGCAATAGTLSNPFSVALNSAQTILFISDLSHGTIRAVNISGATQTWGSVTLTAGDIYTVAGTGTRGAPTDTETGTSVATSDEVDGAHGVWVDPSGNLIVTDTTALTVRKVTMGASNIFTTIVGGNTTAASPVTVGVGIVCPNPGAAYGSNPCGDGKTAAPPTTASTSALVQLDGNEYAMEDAGGNIYITDPTAFRIRLVNNTGSSGTFFGVPIGAGNIGTIVGRGVFGGTGDGTNAAENTLHPTGSALVATPNQMALDAGGSLYFTDAGSGAYEARRVDPTGLINAVAGHAGITTNCTTPIGTPDAIGDGCPATNATLLAPTGVALDTYGNIVIVDGTNYVVRQVNVSTTTVTYAATPAGTTSAAQTLTIYNTSATTLNITGITVTGNFSQSGGTCTTTTALTGGMSCALSIVFSPGALGALTGSVTLASNATNALTINLTGTGSVASSTTAETITPNPAGSGQTITFKATVTGVTAVPTGSVTFAGGTFTSGAVALVGSGGNTATATYTNSSLVPNTYPVVATYSGDVNYNSSASAATSLIVSTKAATTTALSPSTSSPTVGSALTLTATVTGTGPTGSVNFYDGTVLVGSGTLSGSAASIVTKSYLLGGNSFTAVYSGDVNNVASTSSITTVTAVSAPTLFFTPGILTTVAGNGKIGYTGDGASATAATLSSVNGVAVDSAGNLYLADTNNNVVRVVNTQSSAITVAGVSIPAGDIATVAGNGTACAAPTASPACGNGGPATSAQLNLPAYLKLDVAGNIYIADTIDNAIRVVNTQSSAITVAGVTIPAGDIASVVGTGTACAAPTASPACGDTGQASAATLFKPRGVYVDASGNIYVVDNGDYRIRKVTAATGVITTVVGTGTLCASSTAACGDGGQATSAQVASVHGVFVDASGQIYLADTTDNRIRKVSAAGVISTIAGSGAAGTTVNGGTATSALMNFPGDMVVDAAGDVYIAGGTDNLVTMVDTAGTMNFITGNVISGCSTLATTTTASSCYGAGDGGSSLAASVFGPQSLAMDAQGNLYIAENSNMDIRKLTAGAGAYSFGNQAAGTTSAARTVSVLNTGSQVLAVSGLSVPAPFTQVTVGSDCSSSTNLAAGAACLVGISYTPIGTTTSSANATVSSNSTNASAGINTIALSGTGTQTATALSYASAPPSYLYAGGNPGVITVNVVDALGNAVIGDNSDSVTLTISGPSGFVPVATSSTAASGVATFNLGSQTFPVGGQYTYVATSGSLTSVTAAEAVVSNIYSSSTATGGAASSAVAVTLIFNSSFTLGSTSISSMGTAGTAFSIVSGGTCSNGNTYSAGQTCTLMVRLAPTGPNLLVGKVQAYDNAGTPNLVATAYFSSLRYK